jgi:hypothetical protein
MNKTAVAAAILVVFPHILVAQDDDDYHGGTAFAVDTRGKLLTNNHVVKGCSTVTVFGGNGTSTERVEARNETNDVALLGLSGPLQTVALFRPTRIRKGEDVLAVGFPLSGLLATELNVSKGIVSATAGLLNDTSRLQISAAVQPGNSGGPLLDNSGSVAGVVVSKLDALFLLAAVGDFPENVNFAIKGEVAEMFLTSHGVAPRRRAAGLPSPTVPAVVEFAEGYTFAIECRSSKPVTTTTRRDSVTRTPSAAIPPVAPHAEACPRPVGVGIGTMDWARMTTDQQLAACHAAAPWNRPPHPEPCPRPLDNME